MLKVIQPGEQFKDKIKYIIIDSEKKQCKVILNRADESDTSVQKIKDTLPGFAISCEVALTTKEEVKMIWPQLVKEFNDKFSYSKSWF